MINYFVGKIMHHGLVKIWLDTTKTNEIKLNPTLTLA